MPKLTIIFIKVCVIAAVLALFIIIFRFQINSNLSNSLRDLTFESLTVEGQRVQIKKGSINNPVGQDIKNKALRLAAFLQWNKEDPLFYSFDMDTEGIKTSIEVLKREDSAVRSNLKRPKSAHPIKFLEKFAGTSRLTEQFFKNPSDTLAYELIQKQFETTEAYGENIQELISILSPRDIPSPIIFNVKTGPDVLMSDLNKIETNSYALKNEIKQRQECLTGEGKCERPYKNFPQPRKIDYSLKERQFVNNDLIFTFSKNIKKDIIKGPYVSKTNCYGWGGNFSYPQHYFYADHIKAGDNSLNIPMLNIQLATDLYFRKLKIASAPADKVLIERGIKFAFISSTTPYDCFYLGNTAEVAETDKFVSENKPLLGGSPSLKGKEDRIYGNISEAENNFFKSLYSPYDGLSNLADHYGEIYRYISDYPESELAGFLSVRKDELLRRYIVIKRKLGNIDKLINSTTYYTYGFRALDLNPLSERFANIIYYPYRNFYGLFYFPFSESFWRIKENPDYFEKTIVRGAVGSEDTAGFITLGQALRKYSRNEIKEWLVSKPDIIEELIETKEAIRKK